MQQNTLNSANAPKKRTKAAKILLSVELGCIGIILLVMLITFIIAAAGGTGTSNGSNLGLAFETYSSVLIFFIVILVMTWLLTEPSFKKVEEEIEEDTRFQYVKKAKTPHPVVNKAETSEKKQEEPVEETPAEEEPVEEEPAEEEPAEEPAQEEPVEEEPAEEEPVEEEPAEEEPEDEADDDEDEEDDEAEDDDDEDDASGNALLFAGAAGPETVLYRYRRSFMSRIIQASDNSKDYYTEIKNKLLSYKKVNSRVSWSFESFNWGRKKMAKLNVRGKTLVLYLALEPAEFADSKYHVRDMSDKAKYAGVPSMVRVKSPRACKYAIELIELLMTQNEVPVNPKYTDQTFDIAFKETTTLIDEGLIKVVYNKNMDADGNYVTEQADIGDIISK